MNPHRSFYLRFGKRFLDIFLAGSALILFTPIMIVVAILVRCKLGSPILFRQPRPGKDSKTFHMIKFRTMTDARDPQGKLLPDDQRVTRFGKFLRSSSLDELPELLNILRGNMSVVGPRPLMVRYLPYYTEREQRRHDVLPGLTGWAQINGRINRPWDERLEMDIWYVENVSLWLDVKIIVATFWKVIRREDATLPESVKLVALDEERDARMAVTSN